MNLVEFDNIEALVSEKIMKADANLAIFFVKSSFKFELRALKRASNWITKPDVRWFYAMAHFQILITIKYYSCYLLIDFMIKARLFCFFETFIRRFLTERRHARNRKENKYESNKNILVTSFWPRLTFINMGMFYIKLILILRRF